MRRLALTFVLFAGLTGTLSAQERTEEQRLAEMLREAATECTNRLPNGSVRLTIAPENTRPMVAQIFSEELSGANRSVRMGAEPADLHLALDVRAMNSYTVSHGNSSYLRTVSLDLGVLAGAAREDSVLFSKEYTLTRTDTLSGEPVYEERDLRPADDSSWTDAILTPVIATAAAVIIVVLLFTVRGS